MAAVSTQDGDSWDQPSPSSQQPRVYARTAVRAAPVPDDWDASDDDDEQVEDNQKIWADANARAPMPLLIISPSSTASSVVSPPSTVFQAPLHILKRPSASSSSFSAELQTRESLVEREAKYQAARERIFGTDAESGNDWQFGEEKDTEGTMLRNERSRSGTPAHATNVVRNPRGPDEEASGFGGRRSQKVTSGISPELERA